jgi:hypothetical protein
MTESRSRPGSGGGLRAALTRNAWVPEMAKVLSPMTSAACGLLAPLVKPLARPIQYSAPPCMPPTGRPMVP